MALVDFDPHVLSEVEFCVIQHMIVVDETVYFLGQQTWEFINRAVYLLRYPLTNSPILRNIPLDCASFLFAL